LAFRNRCEFAKEKLLAIPINSSMRAGSDEELLQTKKGQAATA